MEKVWPWWVKNTLFIDNNFHVNMRKQTYIFWNKFKSEECYWKFLMELNLMKNLSFLHFHLCHSSSVWLQWKENNSIKIPLAFYHKNSRCCISRLYRSCGVFTHYGWNGTQYKWCDLICRLNLNLWNFKCISLH